MSWEYMWLAPIAFLIIAFVVAIAAVALNIRSNPTSPATPAPTTPAPATPSFWDRVKTWYKEEWVKVSASGVVVLLLLILMNSTWAWWLSGHHPRLFLSLVLLLALGIFALERNHKLTKKWLWRMGLVIVLLFGVLGAILEDYGGKLDLISTVKVGIEKVQAASQEIGSRDETMGIKTVTTPENGDWSEVVSLPSSQPLSVIYAPRTSSVEMRIVGFSKIYTWTADPNTKDPPAEDLKGRGIQFRKKGGVVIVDVVWRKV